MFAPILTSPINSQIARRPSPDGYEAGGQHYQEMHVDGGAVAQTFLYPPQIGILVNLRQGPLARERHAYVIRSPGSILSGHRWIDEFCQLRDGRLRR